MEIKTESAHTTYSVFVIIPETEEKQRFCWVIDKDDHREKKETSFRNLKKMPGGRVEESETLEEAAKTEVAEEVGLRVKILEQIVTIHKPSYFNPDRAHHDIFYASSVPLSGACLKFGEEIFDGGWDRQSKIFNEIKEGKFFSNHAAAFLWHFLREKYAVTKDNSLLTPILRLKRNGLVSWSVEYGKLILCCNPRCGKCVRETNNPDEFKELLIGGRVKFVLFYQDHFEDKVFLEPTGKQTYYKIPNYFFGEEATSEEIIDKIKELSGQEIENLGLYQNNGAVLAVFRCKSREISGLDSICLNRHPDFFMQREEWKDIIEAGKYYNNFICYPKQKLVIYHTWHSMVKNG